MKPVLFIFILGCLSMACQQSQKAEITKANVMSEIAQKNLASMRGVIECFNARSFAKLGDYVAADCFDHYGSGLKGIDAMKAEYEKWLEYTKNSTIKPHLEMANDEYVIMWIHFEETITQDVGDMRAGQKYDKTDIEVGRFENGKLVEHWTFIEPTEMAKVIQIPNGK